MNHLAALITTLSQLKQTKRQGWLDRGMSESLVESVADHSFLTALVAWFAAAADPSLNRDRVLKLALVHDLAEAIIGDAPPYEAHERPDPSDIEAVTAFYSVRHLRSDEGTVAKHAAESRAFAVLAAGVPAALRDEFTSLWNEYEDQTSAESRFVKQVDRLEAYLQSRRYASVDPQLPFWGFTDMAEQEVDHPVLTAIRDAVEDDR